MFQCSLVTFFFSSEAQKREANQLEAVSMSSLESLHFGSSSAHCYFLDVNTLVLDRAAFLESNFHLLCFGFVSLRFVIGLSNAYRLFRY